MAKQKRKDWLARLIISLAIASLVIIVSQSVFFTVGPVEQFRLNHIDERFQNRGAINIKDTANVIILEITQETHYAIPETWPWPRSVLAKVIRNLNKAGVKAIGIDLVMSSADRFSPQNDSDLVDAIREFGNVVLGGTIEHISGSVSVTQTNEGVNIQQSSVGYEIKKTDENYNNIYYKADSSIGIVNVVADNDGVIRRYIPIDISPGGERVPKFGLAVLNKYLDLERDHTVTTESDDFILKNIHIPKYDNISMLINYFGPDRTFPYFNLINVLDDSEYFTKEEIDYEAEINTWDDPDYGLLYSGIFKDKIVLIGSTMPEDKDMFPISFSRGEKKGDNLLYGVEIHANAIQNILSRSFIYVQPQYQEILTIIFFTFLAFFISSFLKEIKVGKGFLVEALNFFLILGLLFLLRWISFYLFDNYNYLFRYTSSTLSIILGYFGSTAYYFIAERKQKTMIKGMFTQYVSSTFVEELVADPEKLKLGGEKKELSVFFSDIAGFSTFSETKTPEDLINFLNEYLSEMTKIVFDNNGTLDKYLGDAVMAFWGAPVPQPNHPYLACKSALLMQNRLKELQVKWKMEGETIIEARMGINTGEMVVGNVGGSQRFDYTVIGDNVNLSSRLEGVNKEYGTYILISDSTYEHVKNDFITREIDSIIVKGKTKPVNIYELIGFAGEELPSEKTNSLKIYSEALQLYREKQFSGAADKFTKVLELVPTDRASAVFVNRCKLLNENPPPEEWDGVFVMKTK
ncbi:MAG TPA: adenylate/guanylate cyclase domain-containing protein [Ignavibacteriaceae bacterium]|nr:adenylate/guanylate cyclase domain-containing protein [Ignavibacteriaceae bacterium]